MTTTYKYRGNGHFEEKYIEGKLVNTFLVSRDLWYLYVNDTTEVTEEDESSNSNVHDTLIDLEKPNEYHDLTCDFLPNQKWYQRTKDVVLGLCYTVFLYKLYFM
jgi:hypothetical protein